MLALIVIGTFLFVMIIMSWLYFYLTRKKQRIMERLSVNLEMNIEIQDNSLNTKSKKANSVIRRLAIPNKVLGGNLPALIKNEIYRAGLPIKIEEFLALTVITSLALAVIGGLITGRSLIAVLSGGIGLFMPWISIKAMKRRRFAKLDQQILDTAILLANSLRAGCSFMQAIEIVSREIPMPLSEEFRRVVRESVVGVPLEEALQNMEKRVGNREFGLVVTGVLIQRQIGGNLAETLDIIADTIDKRIKMYAKINAITAQSRISALVISLLPLCLGVFVFGVQPSFGAVMLKDPKGVIILAIGTVMWVIGVLSVKKVVSIDV